MTTVAAGATATETLTSTANAISITLDAGERAHVSIVSAAGAMLARDNVQTSRVLGPYPVGSVLTITAIGGSIDYTMVDADNYFSTPAGVNADSQTVNQAGTSVSGGGIGATYNVRSYGAKVDARAFYSATVTNGSPVVTVSDASFVAGQDEGKYFRAIEYIINAAPTKALRGRIVSVNSPTQITLDTSAASSFTGGGVYGTDDYAAYVAAFAAAAPLGGTVLVPAGTPNGTMTGLSVLYATSTLIVPDGVTLQGEGNDYPVVQYCPARGSGIFLLNFLGGNAFLQMGSGGGNAVVSGQVMPRIRDISVDAMRLAAQTLNGNSRRSRIERCTIWRATGTTLISGADAWVEGNVIGAYNEGNVFQAVGDCHIHRNVMRQAGSGGYQAILSGYDINFSENHLFSGGGNDTSPPVSTNLLIQNASSSLDGGMITVDDNLFDSTVGAHIKTLVSGSRVLDGIGITNNHFFSNSVVPANTYPILDLAHAAGSTVRALVMTGNKGDGGVTRGTTNSAIASLSNGGTVAQIDISDNHFLNCQKIFNGFLPDAGRDRNSIMTGTGSSGGTKKLSTNNGQSTQNGTGAQTAFTIAHGLDAAPTDIVVTAGSSDARAAFYVTADATNITVTYAAAPASGTGNVVLYWRAGL